MQGELPSTQVTTTTGGSKGEETPATNRPGRVGGPGDAHGGKRSGCQVCWGGVPSPGDVKTGKEAGSCEANVGGVSWSVQDGRSGRYC